MIKDIHTHAIKSHSLVLHEFCCDLSSDTISEACSVTGT